MPPVMKGKPNNLKQEIALAKQREVEVKSVFEKYDVDGSNSIEMDELTALLETSGCSRTSPSRCTAARPRTSRPTSRGSR